MSGPPWTMTGPSSRSGDPLPHVPSQDGVQLAVVLRGLQWELDNLAHALPAGRCHVERLRGMAATLRQLADHMDAVSGIESGESGGDEPV